MSHVEGCPFCAPMIVLDKIRATTSPDVFRMEPLNPVAPGHMLFIPKIHVESARVSPVLAGEAARTASVYGYVMNEEFNVIFSVGANATQTVPHLHVHYVPRREGDGLLLPWGGPRE